MRSRRLPGQREGGRPEPAARPEPSGPLSAPLPSEAFFEEKVRPPFSPRPEYEEFPVQGSPTPEAAEPTPAPAARPEVMSGENFATVYGARSLLTGIVLAQIAIFMLILPRMVNAAETLLFRPGHLVTLAALGAVEAGLWLWSMWTRSWVGTVSCGILVVIWWFYLLAQII